MEIKKWSQNHFATQACLLSDSLDCFKVSVYISIYKRKREGLALVDTKFKWDNTLLSNAKTAFSGALHVFNFHKYSRRYLDEFRINNRFDLKTCFHEVFHSAVISSAKLVEALFSVQSG